MQADELYFVIPTYRLRDVGETVKIYDEHFWRNGHSPTLIVCDDSSPVAQEKYDPLLEQTSTHSELYYVGPREKEQFIAYLSRRLRDKATGRAGQKPVPAQLRRESELHADAYTGRAAMVSSDDDMRPYALMETQSRIARRRRGQPGPGRTGPARTATAASHSTSSDRSSMCWARKPRMYRTTMTRAKSWSTPPWS